MLDPALLSRLYALFEAHPDVTTDTRALTPGAIFFALKGANFDGNRFAADALAAGCAAAVVDDPAAATDTRAVLVPDVLEALQALAAHHRQRLGLPVVEITGTNGKTTTKELCAAVLARKYNVLYTEGNLNNHIGVPRTLLRLRPAHDIAVVETGANHPGEIRDLAAIVQPDAGLITNVGMAHLEGFGSFEGVVSTKCELYDNLRRRGGFVFLHADNDILRERAAGLPAETYGSPQSGAHVQGEAVAGEAFLRLRWRVADGTWHDTPLQLIGAYNAPNALAAIAVGVRYGVAEADIDAALRAYKPTNNRSELRRTATNSLIVDAYNANPTSMRAALENFAAIAHPHKRVVLGEMRELGPATASAHAEVLGLLRHMDLDAAWLVGSAFQEAVAAARDVPAHFRTFPDVAAVRAAIAEAAPADSLILIKGSNGTRLFTLPESL
ncbi:MAG: UDP-N-acetylmuramoyl-tripeptide--D-alanyl-D-alanine ligase [Bacteroidaceae bacterium]|nr:UDP-N-acetylmuramoyl-tripeptide--D-alanyl-D-alanine ligase [Bacteroidaceae bacterium]